MTLYMVGHTICIRIRLIFNESVIQRSERKKLFKTIIVYCEVETHWIDRFHSDSLTIRVIERNPYMLRCLPIKWLFKRMFCLVFSPSAILAVCTPPPGSWIQSRRVSSQIGLSNGEGSGCCRMTRRWSGSASKWQMYHLAKNVIKIPLCCRDCIHIKHWPLCLPGEIYIKFNPWIRNIYWNTCKIKNMYHCKFTTALKAIHILTCGHLCAISLSILYI